MVIDQGSTYADLTMKLSLAMLLVAGVMVLGALAAEDYYGSAGWALQEGQVRVPRQGAQVQVCSLLLADIMSLL